MGGRRWSDKENATLAAIGKEGVPLISQMHRLPGRSWESAKGHATALGIRFSEASTWTDAERAILREIYTGKESIKLGVSRRLAGRSYASAKAEASRLEIVGAVSRGERTGYSWIDRSLELILKDGARLTVKQLAKRVGAKVQSVHNLLSKMRGTKYRVAEWTRETVTGDWAARWELGTGKDAARPPRMTATQCCRGYRQRQRMRAGVANPFASLVQQVAA
jgi:hypothetical protein